MNHVFYVALAYGISGLALTGLVAWVALDLRGRRKELAALEERGIVRRSSETEGKRR